MCTALGAGLCIYIFMPATKKREPKLDMFNGPQYIVGSILFKTKLLAHFLGLHGDPDSVKIPTGISSFDSPTVRTVTPYFYLYSGISFRPLPLPGLLCCVHQHGVTGSQKQEGKQPKYLLFSHHCILRVSPHYHPPVKHRCLCHLAHMAWLAAPWNFSK